MKRLANVLALSGGGLAVAAVGTAYLLKNHWVMQIYWVFLHTRVNRALTLAVALLLLATLVKRSSSGSSSRFGLVLGATSIAVLIVTAAFVTKSALEINGKLGIRPLPTEAKYKFSFDGTSANAKIWAQHLKIFTGNPNIRALEIGSYEGRSALWFLANILTHETSSVTCVDLFEDSIESTFDDNIKASGLQHKVTKLKGDSKVVVRNLKESFDFMYIDGSHMAKDVLVDAVLAWDLLRPGGILIFDDYGFRRTPMESQSTAFIPQPAIDAFLRVFRHYIDVLHQDYQIIVRKKIRPDWESEGPFAQFKSLLF